MRYGDDFIIIERDIKKLTRNRQQIMDFLQKGLYLGINNRNNIITKTRRGIKFLGVWIYPRGRKLLDRNWQRVQCRLNQANIGSYHGLLQQHGTGKQIKYFTWIINNKLC